MSCRSIKRPGLFPKRHRDKLFSPHNNFLIAKLLLGNPVVDVTLFKIEFCTKICVGFLGTYP